MRFAFSWRGSARALTVTVGAVILAGALGGCGGTDEAANPVPDAGSDGNAHDQASPLDVSSEGAREGGSLDGTPEAATGLGAHDGALDRQGPDATLDGSGEGDAPAVPGDASSDADAGDALPELPEADARPATGADAPADTVAEEASVVDAARDATSEDAGDTTPPGTASLRLGAVTKTSVELHWTAVGDDYDTGTASAYELRYLSGVACPIDESNFAGGTLVNGLSAPQPAGATETFVVPSLQEATTYCFALRVVDESGNASLSSSVSEETFGTCTTRSVVISQVYGAGGGAGAFLRNDFIELHNRSNATVSVTGWSVQYAAAFATSWSTTNLTGSIPAGGYYLVAEASSGTGGTALPVPSVTGTINLASAGGKVALLSSTSPLIGSCPAGGSLVDLIGYGTSECSETSPAPGINVANSVLRRAVGCRDTSDNGSDFLLNLATPHGYLSQANTCACP